MLNQQKFENASSREEQLAMMIAELNKRKKRIKLFYVIYVCLAICVVVSLPTILKAEQSMDYFIRNIGIYVVFIIGLHLFSKCKTKRFEAELDEQTTDEEKMLYK